jgi:phosphohistidine phosphatase SixA
VAIGRALATLGVPVGAVLTSAVFRARDTADLAFGPGRAEVVPELVADDYEPDPARVAANARWIARRLATLSRTGATDLLIGHIVPLGLVLGRPVGTDEFPEGAIAVFGRRTARRAMSASSNRRTCSAPPAHPAERRPRHGQDRIRRDALAPRDLVELR